MFSIDFLMEPPYYFSRFYSLVINQYGSFYSFALPAVMGDTGIVLLSQFTLTLRGYRLAYLISYDL